MSKVKVGDKVTFDGKQHEVTAIGEDEGQPLYQIIVDGIPHTLTKEQLVEHRVRAELG